MMFKLNDRIIISAFSLIIIVLAITNCGEKQHGLYSKHNDGFYYHLVSFNSDEKKNNKHCIALLDIAYATQTDSVFWTGRTDYDDKYFMNIDPESTHNFIESYLLQANEGDSVNLLIETKDFFKQQFFTERIPSFAKNDSIIKVNFKIKTLFNPSKVDSLLTAWALNENLLIKKYLKENNINSYYKDSLNVVWLNGKPNFENIGALKNKTISMTYKGYLLNGKQFDESPENWQVNTSTPDQMIKGLNYVIKFLNKGENTKIILPSYLAFGELGTGNIIPPYTPLLYEININDIVN